MLALLIRIYQRNRLANRSVRLAVALHHWLVPAERTGCALPGRCSATGLEEAVELGWRALPGICARMGACEATCWPSPPKTEEKCQGWIGAGLDDLPHYRRC